jgi:hypothetical protein
MGLEYTADMLIILINEYILNGINEYILNVPGAHELNCGPIL